MHEGTGATKVLERILDLGVRLSLDDFGTGYSSLGYLSAHALLVDQDRPQLRRRARRKGVREAIAIIRAVVALAKSLGMATTAEGVETEDEHRMVQELGCTKVQGYYFGRPLPVEEARALACRRMRTQRRSRMPRPAHPRTGPQVPVAYDPPRQEVDPGSKPGMTELYSFSGSCPQFISECRHRVMLHVLVAARPAPGAGARSRPPSSCAASRRRSGPPSSCAGSRRSARPPCARRFAALPSAPSSRLLLSGVSATSPARPAVMLTASAKSFAILS